MRIVGITGGIGAGKSIVSRILRLKGYEVYDCDLNARILMEESEILIGLLRERFGEECYHPSGALNRSFISDRIFSSREEREWLNALVHEAVRKDIDRWIKEEATGKGKTGAKDTLLFIESAILATSGLDRRCDEIWLVEADKELRFRRAFQRGGISGENLEKRMKSQEKEFDSLPRNKVKLIANRDENSLLEQIKKLIKN